MICVYKVWKLIGNNYDVFGKPDKDEILDFGACIESRGFRISNLIHINHSKSLLI